MIIMTTLKINFHEGKYQYSTKIAEMPKSTSPITTPISNLLAGVLDELNHQYNYRPTKEPLWVDVKDDKNDNLLYRVSRIDNKTVNVITIDPDTSKVDEYKFSPLEDYSLFFYFHY